MVVKVVEYNNNSYVPKTSNVHDKHYDKIEKHDSDHVAKQFQSRRITKPLPKHVTFVPKTKSNVRILQSKVLPRLRFTATYDVKQKQREVDDEIYKYLHDVKRDYENDQYETYDI